MGYSLSSLRDFYNAGKSTENSEELSPFVLVLVLVLAGKDAGAPGYLPRLLEDERSVEDDEDDEDDEELWEEDDEGEAASERVGSERAGAEYEGAGAE